MGHPVQFMKYVSFWPEERGRGRKHSVQLILLHVNMKCNEVNLAGVWRWLQRISHLGAFCKLPRGNGVVEALIKAGCCEIARRQRISRFTVRKEVQKEYSDLGGHETWRRLERQKWQRAKVMRVIKDRAPPQDNADVRKPKHAINCEIPTVTDRE